MKILLDECVPRPFCKIFQEHECLDVRRAGFGGKRNGELLTLSEANGFDIFVTVDKSIPYQQNLKDRTIALVILDVQSNKLSDLLPYAPACLSALRSIKPGQVVRLGSSNLEKV
jgi:hypothetical protein